MAERKRRGDGADGESADRDVRDSLDSLGGDAIQGDTPEGALSDSEGSDSQDSPESRSSAEGGVQPKSARRGATAVRSSEPEDSDDADAGDAEKPVKAGKGKDAAARKAELAKKGAAKKGAAKKDGKAGSKNKSNKPDTRARGFGRITRFIREVVAELRKVIWPTRKELVTYSIVVIFFVAIILTIVGLLDYGFAKGALWVFGTGSKK